MSPEIAFQMYSKGRTIENYSKEAKSRFYFDKTDRPTFNENHARMIVSLLARNIVKFMRILYFNNETKGYRVSTIRLFHFKIAGKMVHS